MSDFASHFDQVEQLIRKGQLAAAARQLKTLHRKKVPGRLAARFAELCRRADITDVGARLLFPLIRRPGMKAQGTPKEQAEYAASLVRLGAIDEAIDLLTPLAGSVPMADLYLAFAHLNCWANAAAAEHLRRFLSNTDLDAYWRSIGTYNLAACYTAMDEAARSRQLVTQLFQFARAEKLNFLLGACFELSAQNEIVERNFPQALETLREADRFLASSPSREAFFVKKWKAIALWSIDPQAPNSQSAFAQIRKEAALRHSWETLRQLDYYEFKVTQNPLLLNKLYHGTRFEEFRNKVLSAAQGLVPDRPFQWSAPGATHWIDVAAGKVVDSPRDWISADGLAHSLLRALTSDLYRPFRIPTLHALLYPNEYFHPTGAKYRVHFALQQLRQALSRLKLGVRIQVTNQQYRLEMGPRTGLRLTDVRSELGSEWDSLFAALGENPFRRETAMGILKLSERSMQRLLSDWIEAQACLKEGKGPRTAYRLLPARKQAA